MATIVEELIGLVGLEIDEGSFRRGANALENIGRQYERVAQSARNLALAGAGILAFTAITNKMTAEQARMAEAVGISSITLEALGGIAQQGGLDLERVVDLVEELNNKLGESKGVEEMLAVTEATAILGLEFENLRKLNPEEQFLRILEAAQSLEDQQSAVAAADILFGGDANKFIGLLRTQDKSIRQLIEDYKKLNFLTDQGRNDAKEFNAVFSKTVIIFKTATQQLASLLGNAIEPMLMAFNKWIADNKVLSQSIISLFADVIPFAFAIAGVAVAALTARLIAMAIVFAFNPITLWIAAALVLAAAIGLVVNDIILFVKHGEDADTVIGGIVKFFKETKVVKFFSEMVEGIKEAIKFVGQLKEALLELDLVQLVLNRAREDLRDFFRWFETTSVGKLLAVEATVTPLGNPDSDTRFNVGSGSGGGVGPLASLGNTTNTANNVIYLNVSNIPDFQRVLEEAMAASARSNSTGVLR